jgi:hypothetical protein
MEVLRPFAVPALSLLQQTLVDKKRLSVHAAPIAAILTVLASKLVVH